MHKHAPTPQSHDYKLFIVDNSDKGWNGQRYLNQWCRIATSFDIATGYFEIGSLIALDGQWQKLKKIRILMGSETTYRSKKLILDAVESRTTDELEKRT